MYLEAKERLTKLNLFHADRFPTRDELKDKYGVYIYQNTINDVSDIRADGLNDIQLNEIRDSVRKEYQERITDIISDIILRLREVVVDAIERTTKDPAGVKFATLIKKIENTCDSLNKLNIIGDTRIDNLIKEVLELSKYDPDTLHVSTEDRKTVNTKAKTVLDQLDSFSL